MTERLLTDDDCGRIVRASLDPHRVLGGPDGHDGGEPDVLLVEVEAIVRRHVLEAEKRWMKVTVMRDGDAIRDARAGALREAARELGRGVWPPSDKQWLRQRADQIEKGEL